MGLRFNIGNFGSGSRSKVLITLAIIGGLVAVFYGGLDYLEQDERLSNAVEINATVKNTSIEKEKSSTRRGTSIEYRPIVLFSYGYNGENYSNSNFYPTDSKFSKNTREGAEEVLQDYPEDAQIEAYLDPENPSEGFLRNEKSNRPLYIMAFGVIMAFLGLKELLF